MLELLHLHLVFMALIMWLPRMKLAMNRVTCPLSLGISLGSLIDGAYGLTRLFGVNVKIHANVASPALGIVANIVVGVVW